MAIQMRRGNAVDFNPSKMRPGEWAVSQDNQKIYMCFTPGVVIEMATLSSVITYVYDAEAWAVGERNGVPVDNSQPQYHNNSKYYAEISVEAGSNSEAWAVGQRGGTDVPSTDPTYHNNSKYYAGLTEDYYDYVHDAAEFYDPNFTIDWTTGNLLYTGGYFTFWIDADGYIHWGIESP